MYLFSEIHSICEGELWQFCKEMPVMFISIDSRKIVSPDSTLFIAIKGRNHDAHMFISDVYKQGVRMFIVEEKENIVPDQLPGANLIYVPSSIKALQKIASWHRAHFTYPVIGITGSNGKTIVKEWLSEILSRKYKVIKSPRSYNSQVGVPLSVWAMNARHEIAVFEAGISNVGEMEKLARILKPSIGIFTNLRDAHDEGFETRIQKAEEKMKLFLGAEVLILCEDHALVLEAAKRVKIKTFSWSMINPTADVFISSVTNDSKITHINYSSSYGKGQLLLYNMFDHASIENAVHCACLLLYLGYNAEEIKSAISLLKPVNMRLALREGINNCYIIDDSYNNDMAGLVIAINFLMQQNQREKKNLFFLICTKRALPKNNSMGALPA